MDRNETPVSWRIGTLAKSGEPVRVRVEDMTAVGKPPQRSKAATLEMLQRELADGAFGPYLPVGLASHCVAALPETDIGRYCSILAPQVPSVQDEAAVAAPINAASKNGAHDIAPLTV